MTFLTEPTLPQALPLLHSNAHKSVMSDSKRFCLQPSSLLTLQQQLVDSVGSAVGYNFEGFHLKCNKITEQFFFNYYYYYMEKQI